MQLKVGDRWRTADQTAHFSKQPIPGIANLADWLRYSSQFRAHARDAARPLIVDTTASTSTWPRPQLNDISLPITVMRAPSLTLGGRTWRNQKTRVIARRLRMVAKPRTPIK